MLTQALFPKQKLFKYSYWISMTIIPNTFLLSTIKASCSDFPYRRTNTNKNIPHKPSRYFLQLLFTDTENA